MIILFNYSQAPYHCLMLLILQCYCAPFGSYIFSLFTILLFLYLFLDIYGNTDKLSLMIAFIFELYIFDLVA